MQRLVVFTISAVAALLTPGAHAQTASHLPGVLQVPDDAFRAMFTKEQLAYMSLDGASFSPDGHYLAIIVGDILSGEPEQVWRFDLTTHKLVAISAKPEHPYDPTIDGIGWIGDTLYTAAARTPDGIERKFFLKTEGDTTTEIASIPADLPLGGFQDFSRQVGPYTVEAVELGKVGFNLVAGKTVLAKSTDNNWRTLDGPPTLIFSDPGSGSITVVDLKTLRRHQLSISASEAGILAAQRTPTGFLLAYSVPDACQPAESPAPGIQKPQERHVKAVCIVDLPYRGPHLITSRKATAK